MNGILIPTLYGLSGLCGYAALHHGFIASRRPLDRTHFLFALLCLAATLYVIVEAGVYSAESAQALVAIRRWELAVGLAFCIILPWFIGEYSGIGPRWLLLGLSIFFAILSAASLALPYGLVFVELPNLEHLILPWGERVVSVRVDRHNPWQDALWPGFLLTFAYSLYATVGQYRLGAHRQALTLGLAMGLFLVSVLFNMAMDYGLVNFTHTAEFGFVALVVVMNQELIRERRQSRLHMQALLDNLPAVVYMKDLEGRYLMSNRPHADLLHATNGLVAGKTDNDLFTAEQAQAFRANDRQVLESGLPLEFEETADKEGAPRIYTSLKFPLLHPDGTPYAVGGVSTDVTELRKAEREMQSLRRQVWHADRVERTGALAASLAHELSQPLTAILSNAQAALRFLAQGEPDLKEIRDILQDIVRDEKRASGVINGLRAMLRRQETARERIDLAICVGEILKLMHSEFLARHIEVGHALAVGCTALADKVQIQQVLVNLLMNASEAMAEMPVDQRRLRVSVARVGEGEARIAVRDSGPGIPQEQLDKVFDGFYTTKAQGLGMGLAVCRAIVESHGGTIWAEQNQDQGATFFITLPLDTSGNT